MKNARKIALVIVGAVALAAVPVRAERLRDMSKVVGARPNQLVGYGIVVGLQNTGDGKKAEFTLQSVGAMLRRLGIRIDPTQIKIKNAAAVMVTAELPAFARPGQKIDVTVSSVGDAKSLRGGTLIQTPLSGADRQVYAVAQGSLTVGGYTASGSTGASKTSGHPTVGRIPQGAFVEKEVGTSLEHGGIVMYSLNTPDSVTAARMVTQINGKLGGTFARADDPGMITVKIPHQYKGKVVNMLADLGNLDVVADSLAKIVINERTGTIVVGAAVQLKPAAIAHGGLTVTIKEGSKVSQPPPISLGRTATTKKSSIDVEEGDGMLTLIPESPTVGDLVNALNALGVKPSNLIVIFQALAAAGALNAEIEVQ